VGGTIAGIDAGVILETQTSTNEATIINSGMISASNTILVDGGVFLREGGLVINNSDATIYGYLNAISSLAATTVTKVLSQIVA
jgi:hypothetical protein